MTTGHVFIATSLDGFIAREDGDIAWLMTASSESEDHGYDRFMASIDAIVMGRGTFEKVLSFHEWPYQKPVIVMSRSLRAEALPAALAGKVEMSTNTPVATLKTLSRKGVKRAYIDGGQIIQSFLRAGLIDDMILTRVPVLLGKGRSLFGALPHDVRLDHMETTTFPSGLVQSSYRVRRDL